MPAAGTPGYDASVQYVVERMTAAGYQVTLDEFPFEFQAVPTLQQLTPASAAHEAETFVGSGSGSVTAAVTAVDVVLALPHAPVTSGCEAADFAGFPAGNIALVQRGTCTFAPKAENAQAAGAAAAIIFNQGNTPERELLLTGGTPAPFVTAIPVVGVSFATGAALAQPGSTATLVVTPPQIITQVNVIAETAGGAADNVVMAGAHLDSVTRGPGINDNGSGSAVLLEVAEGLSDAERDRIALYLNFDMVGSPNHVFFIYDGDDSDAVGAPAGPQGSAQIEQTFERFFLHRGLPFKGTDFSGRSDYGPFIARGIPSGGLFTGAEGVKTAEEAALWGGVAGQAYDPCYHQGCDTFANNNDQALDVNADAVAFAILSYAMSTQDVNGQRGKGNFRAPGQVPKWAPFPPQQAN